MTLRIITALLAASSLAAQVSHTHLSSTQSANHAGEICAVDPTSGRCFVTNPVSAALDVYSMSATGALTYVASIALTGQPNSVAVHGGLVAVAVEGATGQSPGAVQFFAAATGAPSGAAVTVGAMPDMLTFTPDGTKVLTANEGEADLATGLINPEGSVSIIEVASRTAQTASFAPWNGQKASLKALGVRIADTNGITLAQDLEPEYLTIDPTGATAYVTMQEANAIAVVDVVSATVTQIHPLGEKDHALPGNELDPSNQDGVVGNFQNPPIRGIYMPDAICSFTIGGITYLATANEGDSRADFAGFDDETRGASLDNDFVLDAEDPTPDTGIYGLASLNDNALLGRLNFVTSDYDRARGDTDADGDIDQLYSFGGRSFTIWTTGGVKVFESCSQIEREMLARGLLDDSRSDDKGPEPEAVTFGLVDGVPVLFVGLERSNAVMLYDVSNPAAPALLDVIDVAAETGFGSTAPEGLHFVAASENPTGRALLAVACEGNGTLSLFAVDTGLAVARPFGSGCPAALPLALTSSLPILGGTWTLTAMNVAPAATSCAFWFSEQALPTGVDLTQIGAPGCLAYITPAIGPLVATASAGTSSLQVSVPADTALRGYTLVAQSLTFDGVELATSNAMVATVGN